jgi:hypothetical protein
MESSFPRGSSRPIPSALTTSGTDGEGNTWNGGNGRRALLQRFRLHGRWIHQANVYLPRPGLYEPGHRPVLLATRRAAMVTRQTSEKLHDAKTVRTHDSSRRGRHFELGDRVVRRMGCGAMRLAGPIEAGARESASSPRENTRRPAELKTAAFPAKVVKLIARVGKTPLAPV